MSARRNLVAVVTLALLVSAASEPLSWARVESVRPGTRLIVSVAGAGSLQRVFVSANTDSLTVGGDKIAPETIQRSAVTEIAVVGSWALRGALIGGGTIGAVGVANQGSPEWVILTVGLWAGFWSLVGRNFATRHVIYRSP